MKNKITLLFLVLSTMLFTSCDNDDDNIGATAEITVFENGTPQSGVTVHMFRSNQGPNSNFFRPFYSNRSVVTDSDGKAVFLLRETFDLEIVNPQTTIYFGVFGPNDQALGHTGVTVQIGENVSANINL